LGERRDPYPLPLAFDLRDLAEEGAHLVAVEAGHLGDPVRVRINASATYCFPTRLATNHES